MRNLRQQVAQPQEYFTTYIYALVDPVTQFVRYIGKANDPVLRLSRHMSKAELRPNTHKAHWLKKLIATGLKPELMIIEEINTFQWQKKEREWIAYYRNIPGYPPLTNETSGGDGIDKGTKFSIYTRQKMSASRMGMKISPETIAKRLATIKGRPFTDEHRHKISESNKRFWGSISDKEKKERLSILRLHPKSKKVKPPKPPNKTHRVYPDKEKCSSKFRGVCHANIGKPWRAFCSIGGKLKHLGCFVEEEDAARAFDRFVIANDIVDAQTNFPRAEYE